MFYKYVESIIKTKKFYTYVRVCRQYVFGDDVCVYNLHRVGLLLNYRLNPVTILRYILTYKEGSYMQVYNIASRFFLDVKSFPHFEAISVGHNYLSFQRWRRPSTADKVKKNGAFITPSVIHNFKCPAENIIVCSTYLPDGNVLCTCNSFVPIWPCRK